jgi:hypothetical protein
MNKAVHVMEAERSRQVDIMRQRVQQERDRQKVSSAVGCVDTDALRSRPHSTACFLSLPLPFSLNLL